ncbi:MAG: 1,2-phenylacetyl-CoA epoxidase subunit PaaD [Chitinophagales bacterium]
MNQESIHTAEAIEKQVWKILEGIHDPEVPVLSILDLGIVRKLEWKNENAHGELHVFITPTYSGCPAMDMIRMQIRWALLEAGFKNLSIETVLSPAWTTDWMTEQGKQKLKSFGIAPPNPRQLVCDTRLFHEEEAIQCPRCNSYHTQLISQFGSTACKAMYGCLDCQEPFDYFKCH